MISVIIPAYNAERFLSGTLESVRGQSYEDWELIVVDDGSSDSTCEIVERFAAGDRRFRLAKQQNGRVAAARNRGFEECSKHSEYVAFLDHDDVWDSEALQTLLRPLNENRDMPAAHGVAQLIDANGNAPHEDLQAWCRDRKRAAPSGILQMDPRESTGFSALVCKNPIVSPGQALIRRSAMDKAGPFDPQVVPSDDWDMWLRLSLQGGLAFVDEVVLGWRDHGANGTHRRRQLEASAAAVRTKLLAMETLTDEQRKIAEIGFAQGARSEWRSKLHFASEDLKRLRIGSAARQFAVGIRAYLQRGRRPAA